MSESTADNKSTETPPSTQTTATAPVTTAPAAKAKAGEGDPEASEPLFIKDRIDRAERALLKELGVKLKRGEDPQERINEFKEQIDLDRNENKDLKKKVQAHEDTIAKLAASTAAVKVFADMEFNALSEAQQKIVVAAAGDDPNERLKTIAIMKATAPQAPVSAVASAPIPAPVQTAPVGADPVPGTSQPVDVRAEHARLQQTNPLLAAAYLLQNRSQYYKQPT